MTDTYAADVPISLFFRHRINLSFNNRYLWIFGTPQCAAPSAVAVGIPTFSTEGRHSHSPAWQTDKGNNVIGGGVLLIPGSKVELR